MHLRPAVFHSVLLSLCYVGVLGASFANQLALAATFGAGAALDAYLAAGSAPASMLGIAAMVTTYSIAPYISRIHAEQRDTRRAAGELLQLYTAGIVTLTVAGLGLTYGYMLISPAATRVGVDEFSTLLACWWIAGCLVALSGFFAALLNTMGITVFPLLMGVMPPFLSTCLILTIQDVGIVVAILGTICGAGLGALLLGVRAKPFVCLTFRRLSPESYRHAMLAPVVAIGTSCFAIYPLIDAVLAPQLGEASLSHLNIAQKIMLAVGGIVVAGPFLRSAQGYAKRAAAGELVELRNDFVRVSALLVTIGLACAAGSLFVGEQAVQLLFEHGRFSRSDVIAVNQLLPYLFTGMGAMLSVALGFRVLYSIQAVWEAVWLGVAWSVLYAGVGTILTSLNHSKALAIAYCIAWVLTGLALQLLVRRACAKRK